jgi:hypothetical protein
MEIIHIAAKVHVSLISGITLDFIETIFIQFLKIRGLKSFGRVE